MTGEPPGLDLVTVPGRACPVCGGEILAALKVPHGWTNTHGKPVNGTAEVLLCENCDRDDPITGPIVLFFAVHGQVTADHTGELVGLLKRWAGHAAVRRVDERALAAEVEAWHRGDL
jgi:hypothetical protein